jgi:hypothetical protein
MPRKVICINDARVDATRRQRRNVKVNRQMKKQQKFSLVKLKMAKREIRLQMHLQDKVPDVYLRD